MKIINVIQLPFTVNESLYDIGVYKIVDSIIRYLRKLKNNVRNKVKVEGSICNAYLVEEASTFCEHYFNPMLHTRYRRMPCNVKSHTKERNDYDGKLSIFTHPGRPFGRHTTRMLSEREMNVTHQYVLLNCIEVKPYIE